MAQVLIRNIDPEVVDRLKRRADADGLSLEAYLRKVVSREAGGSRADVVGEIDTLRSKVRPPAAADETAEALVRTMRDERATELERRSRR